MPAGARPSKGKGRGDELRMVKRMTTIRLSASADFGQTGQYVARITGRHSKFTFEREFIGSRGGKRGDFSSADVDDPGLYEIRDATRKGKIDRYRVIVAEGDLVLIKIGKDAAMAIARALGEGRPLGEIVRVVQGDDGERSIEILSAKQAEKISAALDVDAAIAACWDALEGLDPKGRKSVLSALRAKLAPPKSAALDEASHGIHDANDGGVS